MALATKPIDAVIERATSTSSYTEVAQDIYQVRLPLPFALNHVNCYLLRDKDGWTMLDSGLDRPEIRAAWEEAFTDLEIEPQQIRQVVLTHMHPDHYGLSGYFQAITGAPVYLSPRESVLAQQVWVENAWQLESTAEYWRMGGIPQHVRGIISAQTERLRQMTMPHPHHVTLLEPGSTIEMGNRLFQAILAPGHSDGQLIFYDPVGRLMLCGDQVLKTITPNIGLWPSTEANPLGRYLESLRKLAEYEVDLALPGHGSLITQWQQRLADLKQHHMNRLEVMRRAIEGGSTALEVARHVFDFATLSEHEVRFALAETLAHLEYLSAQGRVRVVENGVRKYFA